MKSWQRHRRIS
jgi:DNA replication protein DnaC